MLRNILLLVFVLLIVSCKEKKTTKKSMPEVSKENVVVKEPNEANDCVSSIPKDTIEEERVNVEFDDYLITVRDSMVSLCCMDVLYNPFGNLSDREIASYLSGYTKTKEKDGNSIITVFKKASDSVSLVIWKSEYREDHIELFLGKGQITDCNVRLKNGIKIGMAKDKFIKNFFQFSDSLIGHLNQVSVCQDERGELFTKYKFVNDTLSIIKFGESEEF